MFHFAPTPYDFRFHVAGIPVRVHPMFWAGASLLGLNSDPGQLLMWVGVVFFSILIHELGHALLMRYFGQNPHIVLHMAGGYASPNADYDSFSYGGTRRLTWGQQILVLLAGPGAGFLLAALILIGLAASGQHVELVLDFPVFWQFSELAQPQLDRLLWMLLVVNVYWGIMNLVPVYPLDGGQIARELFMVSNPWNGLLYSLYLSFATAVVMVLVGLANNSTFIAILFGFFAYQSYQMIQQMGGGGGYGRRPW